MLGKTGESSKGAENFALCLHFDYLYVTSYVMIGEFQESVLKLHGKNLLDLSLLIDTTGLLHSLWPFCGSSVGFKGTL